MSNLGSVLALGSLGSLLLATLADRFGRRRLIAIGVAGSSIASFASAFAPSLTALSIFRLVAVCFEVLVAGVATALIVEEAPPGRRGQAVAVLSVLGGLIGTGLTVVSYPLLAPHWRWLFLAGGAGLLATPAIWLWLPEGRTWQKVRPSGSALRLLIGRPWRGRLLLLSAKTALVSVLLTPAGLLFTVFASENLHMTPVAISALIVTSAAAGGASFLAGGYLSDRFGRRWPAIALTATTAVATSLSFVSGLIGFVVGNVLWSAVASAATPIFGAWSAELFPTRARATAEAAGSVAFAIGGVAGLQAVGVLSRSFGLGLAIGMVGVAALAGAALLFLLPETKQAPLPD